VKTNPEKIGMESERVEMYNLSSAQGPRFAEIATEMTERAKQLGPSPLNPMLIVPLSGVDRKKHPGPSAVM
jgi:coenzyme F420-reducing hydrogenase delta subunit